MASNYTENYGLCQWEATDQVLREEFNQDNAAVDEALKGTADLAQAAQVLAQAAYSPENSPIAVGSYTGNGAAKRKIKLGFTPKAVLVVPYDTNFISMGRYLGGLAVTGCNACNDKTGASVWKEGISFLGVTSDGFYISHTEDTVSCNTNDSGELYLYFAAR